MTDKIQKIKDWISKTQDGLMDANGNFENPSNEGAFHILSNLDYYIDSLQEEHVSMWHDPSKETPVQGSNILMVRKEEDTNFPPIAGCFHGTNSRLDGRNWGYYNGFCYNEIEPPIKWAYIDDILNLSNVERTVKNRKEPVSEDLKEAGKQYLERSNPDRVHQITNAFKAGANWQKQQESKWSEKDDSMLKEIIDSVTGFDATTGTISVCFEKHEAKIKWLKSLKERFNSKNC